MHVVITVPKSKYRELLTSASNIPPLHWAVLIAAFFSFNYYSCSLLYAEQGVQMFRFVLKLIGASFLVLWWLLSGFFKKILDVLKLIARIKKIFISQKENSKGGDS